jgi:hypothetical protein
LAGTAFLITGSATNLSTLGVLSNLNGRRTTDCQIPAAPCEHRYEPDSPRSRRQQEI